MAGGTLIASLTAAALLVSAVWMAARKVVWKDQRPGLAVYGDLIELPAEAFRAGGETSGRGGSEHRRLDTHNKNGPCRTDRRGAL